MDWVKVLPKDQLPEGDRHVTRVGGKSMLLIHHQGELYATDNSCPHMGLPLQLARIDQECALHCPWHRSAFDLKTGDVKAWSPWPPGLGRVLGSLSRRKTLPLYPVKIEEGSIWVGLERMNP
jgi:nitrite reductase/ring-hydroxylating ferredoxin subunit